MKKTTENYVSNNCVASEDYNSTEYLLKVVLGDVVKEGRSLSDEIIGAIALILFSIVLVFEKGSLVTRIIVSLPFVAMAISIVTTLLQGLL
ncbi:MAG: hypothetical protein RR415_08665 [Ruthenibacterium sp.]